MTKTEWIARRDLLRSMEKHWKEDVATRVEAWRQENGFATKVDFAAHIGISPNIYLRVSWAESVAAQDVYARLYLFTGIEVVKPTNIPDIVKRIPSGYINIVRRMSDEEWDKWLSENMNLFRTPRPPDQVETTPASKIFLPVSQDGTHVTPQYTPEVGLAQQIESLLTTFSTSVAEKVAQELRIQRHPVIVGTSEADTRQLIRQFGVFLRSYMEGSAEDRAQLVRHYGKELASLLPLLTILTIPDQAKREQRIHMQDKFSGKVG